MARSSQYRLPSSGTDRGDPRGLAGYIQETAAKYKIDPKIALKVAKSEGLAEFSGDGGKSGGAFQLYTGGGLGNKFKKETGLDPLDPANEKATIDYALKYASQHGWGSWYGAPKVGVGEWDGIGTGAAAAGGDKAAATTDAAAGYGGVGSDAAASERAANVDTTIPEVTPNTPQTPPGASTDSFIDKLQDPKTGASAGLGEAISGLGQAVTGSGKSLYDTASTRAPAPAVAATPSGIAPMVNPQVVEQQRQQLATAMQKLNSGRLY
jgi:hypothetical protein